MSSRRAFVEEFSICTSWIETVNFVSALAMPPILSLRLRTSCSAGRSAGLDLFALSFTQTKAGMYFRNWKLEEEVFCEEWLFVRCCEAPGVLSESSSRIVDLESLNSIIMLCVVCRCRASQLVE